MGGRFPLGADQGGEGRTTGPISWLRLQVPGPQAAQSPGADDSGEYQDSNQSRADPAKPLGVLPPSLDTSTDALSDAPGDEQPRGLLARNWFYIIFEFQLDEAGRRCPQLAMVPSFGWLATALAQPLIAGIAWRTFTFSVSTTRAWPSTQLATICDSLIMSLIHIRSCRRSTQCRSRWTQYH